MKSSLPDRLKSVRIDISDWLWHFTNANGQEVETLRQIIDCGHLRGGTDKYCPDPAVCFTEMPLTAAIAQLDPLRAARYPRLSGYGIGFPKSVIFGKDGRPVIYQPDAERKLLDPVIRWRHCTFDPTRGIDFTWQREWRVPGPQMTFTEADTPIVVVPTHEEGVAAVTTALEWDLERDEVYWETAHGFVTHGAALAVPPGSDIEAFAFR